MLEKKVEKERIIRRFIKGSRELYRLGKVLGIEWLHKYDEDYLRSQMSQSYFYIPSEDEEKLVREIASRISDEALKESFDTLQPRDWLGCGFRGRYYAYREGEGLRFEDSWPQVKKDVMEVLAQLGERGYLFLKAILELNQEGKWSGDYFGASYSEVLAKMRQLAGRPVMLAPRDFTILKSYRVYYKSGSNRYPTHSIPEEAIPAIKEALEELQKESEETSHQEEVEQEATGAFRRSWDEVMEEFK